MNIAHCHLHRCGAQCAAGRRAVDCVRDANQIAQDQNRGQAAVLSCAPSRQHSCSSPGFTHAPCMPHEHAPCMPHAMQPPCNPNSSYFDLGLATPVCIKVVAMSISVSLSGVIASPSSRCAFELSTLSFGVCSSPSGMSNCGNRSCRRHAGASCEHVSAEM